MTNKVVLQSKWHAEHFPFHGKGDEYNNNYYNNEEDK